VKALFLDPRAPLAVVLLLEPSSSPAPAATLGHLIFASPFGSLLCRLSSQLASESQVDVSMLHENKPHFVLYRSSIMEAKIKNSSPFIRCWNKMGREKEENGNGRRTDHIITHIASFRRPMILPIDLFSLARQGDAG
jgi:hypothetical protein